MSIATELEALNTNIKNAYDAIDTKGGTIPQNKNMVNLPTSIASIPSGGGGGIGIPRELDQNGKMIQTSGVYSLPNSVKDIGDYGMYYAEYANTGITKVDFSNITSLTGKNALYYAFYCCSGITEADFSSLTTMNCENGLAYALRGCSSLTTVKFDSLTTIEQKTSQFNGCFYQCDNLENVTFPALTTIKSNNCFSSCFDSCTNLKSLSFPELTTITSNIGLGFSGVTNFTSLSMPKLQKLSGSPSMQYVFRYGAFNSFTFSALNDIKASQPLRYLCYGRSNFTLYFPALTASSFGSYTNQFSGMFQNGSNNTVHFPSALQSTLSTWSDVQNGFGGTNTTVLYDL